MNCNTTHYRANSSSVPGDPTGDGFADLWESQADAIWSVANYLNAHGWQRGLPVAEAVSLTADFDRTLISQDLRPTRSLGEFRRSGVIGSNDPADDLLATLMLMQGAEGEEFWLGYENFYVITRYNISSLYALAVFQLSEAVAERYQERL